jgi:hypothetical protein
MISPMGCNASNRSEYATFSVNEGPASFSFEYPSFFQKPLVTTTYPGVDIRVWTGAPALFEILDIRIFSASDSYPDSSTMLEDDLKIHQKLSDFRLLERSAINVSGIPGELIAYSHTGGTELTDNWTSFEAYFDHGEFIWKVSVDIGEDEDGAKDAKAHLEHVLETFKILE